MNYLVKFQDYEKQITVDKFTDLQKQIKKAFRYELKNRFSIYYLDNDDDKITVSNQEDLDAINSPDLLELNVEIIENEPLSDDSFEMLNKSVKEQFNRIRKQSENFQVQKSEKQDIDRIKQLDTIKVQIQVVQEKIAKLKCKEQKLLDQKLKIMEPQQLILNDLIQEIIKNDAIEQVSNADLKNLNTKAALQELKGKVLLAQQSVHKILDQRYRKILQQYQLQKEYTKQHYKVDCNLQALQKRITKKLPILEAELIDLERKQKLIQSGSYLNLDIMANKKSEILAKQLDEDFKKQFKQKKQESPLDIEEISDESLILNDIQD
ncbi:hypothetical protein pb186bvf_018721 [Paramecium bursaria]